MLNPEKCSPFLCHPTRYTFLPKRTTLTSPDLQKSCLGWAFLIPTVRHLDEQYFIHVAFALSHKHTLKTKRYRNGSRFLVITATRLSKQCSILKETPLESFCIAFINKILKIVSKRPPSIPIQHSTALIFVNYNNTSISPPAFLSPNDPEHKNLTVAVAEMSLLEARVHSSSNN